MPCEYCYSRGLSCIMDPSRSVKCSVCARQGKKCVDVSWGSLDRTRSTTQEAIQKEEDNILKLNEELSRINQKLGRALSAIQRSRKILQLADARATAKTICLGKELEEEEEAERRDNPDGKSNAEREADASELAALSSAIGDVDWDQLGFEPLVLPEETPPELPSSSQDAQ